MLTLISVSSRLAANCTSFALDFRLQPSRGHGRDHWQTRGLRLPNQAYPTSPLHPEDLLVKFTNKIGDKALNCQSSRLA